MMDTESKALSFLSYWYIINDNVMGGESSGSITQNGDVVNFTGAISLENNGGFSSTLVPIKKLAKNLGALALTINGDGRRYQIRAVVKKHGYRLAYKHEFDTTKNTRENFIFLLKNFKASFRGRIITDAPELRSEDIDELGFLISSKQAGNFSLMVYNLSIPSQK